MKGAYTPAPWHLEDIDSPDGARIMAGDRFIGTAKTYPKETGPEKDANARVMVVSVELLETVDDLLLAAAGNLPEDFQPLIDYAKALSNKAKGIS